MTSILPIWGCIYQCKDTNFKANHNNIKNYDYYREVVFTNAKILILKLITTEKAYLVSAESCIYQCKDTNFKANHNLYPLMEYRYLRCIYQCKDTNFKANHNTWHESYFSYHVVFTNAKILILKLITTHTTESRKTAVLYLPMQRY